MDNKVLYQCQYTLRFEPLSHLLWCDLGNVLMSKIAARIESALVVSIREETAYPSSMGVDNKMCGKGFLCGRYLSISHIKEYEYNNSINYILYCEACQWNSLECEHQLIGNTIEALNDKIKSYYDNLILMYNIQY